MKRKRRELRMLIKLARDNLSSECTPQRIVEMTGEVLGSQRSAMLWMQMPQVAFGETIPLELCRTAAGRRKVMNVLGAIEDGGYL